MKTFAATQLDETAIRELKGGLRGALLQPGEEGYDSARRIWNAMIDRKPALV